MKKLLTLIVLMIVTISFAQIDYKPVTDISVAKRIVNLEEMTPNKVKQSRYAKSGITKQARDAYYNGSALPQGFIYKTLDQVHVMAFSKLTSRDGLTDKAFFLPVGTVVILDARTGRIHYPPCMNILSTLEPVHLAFTVKEVLVEVEKPTQTQTQTQVVVNNCDEAAQAVYELQASYDAKQVSRKEAKRLFEAMKVKYPTCLANAKLHWRNTGWKIAGLGAAILGTIVTIDCVATNVVCNKKRDGEREISWGGNPNRDSQNSNTSFGGNQNNANTFANGFGR